MVYTKKSPALFIIGVIMLAIWFLASNGMLDGYMEHLAAGKKYKYGAELMGIPLYFGVMVATQKVHGIITHRQLPVVCSSC